MATSPELPDLLSVLAGPRTDPGPLVAHLRERDPVCWIPGLEAWVVTRHEDVRILCVDPRLTADACAYEHYQPPTDAKGQRWLSAIPFRATPANPESLGRRLVFRTLTPRAIERTKHRIKEVVEEFAAPIRHRSDVVDLVKEFTKPVSASMMGRLLGIPPEREADFLKLPRAARNIRPFLLPEKRAKAERSGIAVCEFVFDLIEARRETLREGIITDLLAASDARDHTTHEDIVRVAAALVSTGTGTAGNAASRALLSLLTHPDQLERLRSNPELLPNAIEELLRYDSGIVAMARYALEDFELHGRPVKKGQLVILSITGANRDPRVFPDPERIDLERDTRAAVAFGHGQHYCVGINIARSALHLTLESALDFLPDRPVLLEDQIRWSAKGLMGHVKSMPVDFGAKPSASEGAAERGSATSGP